MKVELVFPIALVLAGCAASYQFTGTGKPATPKPPNCEIGVSATVPGPEYEELGILQPVANPTRDIREFKESVREPVCRAGGDHVVGEINGLGIYVRGVVFRKVTDAK